MLQGGVQALRQVPSFRSFRPSLPNVHLVLHDVGVEYKGYNGSVVVDGAAIIITHSGMAAKASGLVRDKPRRVPLQAVSGVGFRAATKLTNGAITFGVGGEEGSDAGIGKTATSANAVSFRHKDSEVFRKLYEWLLAVVEYNRANNIDPASVEFDDAEPSRLDRVSASLKEKRAKPEERLGAHREAVEKLEGAKQQEADAAAPPPALPDVVASPPSPTAPADDPYEALARLASLRDEGILTEEEFSAMKQTILGLM